MFSDASASLPTTASDDWAVAAGDVDQDGDLDLVIVVQQGLPRLLLNQGGGRFVPSPAAIPSLTMAATDAHLADLDQDGDLDLLVAGRYEPVRVFLNDGTGTFQTGGSYPASNSALTYRLAIGDVDQDGDLDVYMANSGQNTPTLGQDVLLLGDGQGGFSVAAGALPVVADDAIGVTFLDVEGDGDLDVCTANFTTPPKLLINDGQGVFTDETTLRLPSGVLAGGASCVVSADLNRDGFPDLFVGVERRSATSPTSVNRIYLNDGTGRFMDAPNLLPADADPTWSVRLADVDADGWVDVLVANMRAAERLYLNRQGVLQDASGNLPAANLTASDSLGLAVGDLNGDRAEDVIFVRRNEAPVVYRNTPR